MARYTVAPSQLGRYWFLECDRFLRTTPTGKLRVDRTAVRRDAHYDGKYLLRTPDESLSPTDIAEAYKSLYEAERGWRDLKTVQINLRPVYHHKQQRIQAHVQLCWLALLLLRVAELGVGDTWRNIRDQPDRLHLVTLATPDGRGRPTRRTHPRATRHPARPRAARTAAVLRLHPHQPLTPPHPSAVVTRPLRARTRKTPGHTPNSAPSCAHHLRNPGQALFAKSRSDAALARTGWAARGAPRHGRECEA